MPGPSRRAASTTPGARPNCKETTHDRT
jgi:hypothetical protein